MVRTKAGDTSGKKLLYEELGSSIKDFCRVEINETITRRSFGTLDGLAMEMFYPSVVPTAQVEQTVRKEKDKLDAFARILSSVLLMELLNLYMLE
ncbi:MAG TPA: hypothetical protein VEV15_06345 [Flavisolibacter sp.]|nr:hypothetical protein [Flavisolibacter sp.]